MAWVRIHDGAIHHPKVIGLIDWSNPFCVWVWGLSYSQEYLTDGLIPKIALPNPKAARTAAKLVTAGMWHECAAGLYRIHDYLDWNDSKDVIQSKRKAGRDRVEKWRRNGVSERVTEDALPNAHIAGESVVNVGLSGLSEEEPERKPAADERRSAPERRKSRNFGRIYLHLWQQESLISTLGEHSDGFELDVWLDDLNRRIMGAALPADPWKYVQAELQAELQRRGLAVVVAPSAPTNKRIAGLMVGGEAFLRRVADAKTRGHS